jgi:hypothetical protein
MSNTNSSPDQDPITADDIADAVGSHSGTFVIPDRDKDRVYGDDSE